MRSIVTFDFKVSAAFLAAALVVCGLAVTNWRVANHATEAVQRVAHSHEVLNGLAHTAAQTLQIEFSTQNFRLTGDNSLLLERDEAIAEREVLLSHLKELTADNAVQQARWVKLREVLNERLAIFHRAEEILKKQGHKAAKAFVSTAFLQESRERTHGLLHAMEVDERQLLAHRISTSSQARQAMVVSGSSFALLLLALLGGTFAFIRRQMRQTEASRRAVAESEESLSITLLSIGDAVIATDTQQRVTRMNPIAERLTGWPLADAKGRHIEDVFHIIHEHTRAPALIPVADALSTGEVQELAQHTVLIARDGVERPIADSAAPIRNMEGRVDGVVLVFRDVTVERKAQQIIREQNELLEQRIQERTKQLSEMSERYRTVFRTSPDAVAITRLSDGTYLDVNDGFLHLFGWSREGVIGKTSRDIGMWHNWDDRFALIHTMQRDGHCENLEAIFVAKDGRRVASLVSANVLDLGGESCMLSVTQDMTERKQAQERIQNLAFFDPLTALPNRRLLMDRLEQAVALSVRDQHQGALVFVDLDDFKSLNETLGHDHGDLLLKQVASRLTQNIRLGDTVAHIGGDEFVVLLEGLSQNPQEAATQAKAVVEKILIALDHPYLIGNAEHHGSCSCGITMFGDQQESAVEPLKRAELAMYQAKADGRTSMCFFEPHMQAAVNARVAMEVALRDALENKHFLLHYQAQIADAGQITGAEALVRWQDPLRGMVSPADFIPLAEDSGLILPLGRWVMETACLQLAQWAKLPEMAHLTLAVNVSARQFHQEDFVAQVLATLEHTGARADRLKLELTESLLVTNVEEIIAKMSDLQRLGVAFSLDDFGTGYSSLSYLKRLPLDQLKIDQGFVREILVDANDAAIAKMVIALAESMGLAVIAEGVETQAQCDFLASLGCHHYQGYLFSRPLPIQAFEAFARAHVPR